MVEQRVGFCFPSLRAVDEILRGHVELYERRVDIYQRFFNRTIADAEAQLGILEGAEWAVLAPSGMAAIDLALTTLSPPGAHWVIPDCLYPGTRSYAEAVLRERRGWKITLLACPDGEPDWQRFEAVLRSRPTGLLLEVIANPIAFRLPAESLVEMARRHGVPSVIDNTLATSAICRPLEWGAEMVVHSATKFLSGGQVLAGVICGNDGSIRDQMRSLRRRAGNVIAPAVAARLIEAARDFRARFLQQCRNAAAISAVLAGHPAVQRVVFPGLIPGAVEQSGGAVLTVWLGGATASQALERRDRFVAALGEPVRCSTSLGSQVTGILHLGALDPAIRGCDAAAIRISAGTEPVETLRATFERGLAALRAG